MSYPIDGGKLLNVVAMDMEERSWEHEKWLVPTEWDALAQRFEGWGKHAQGLIQVCSHSPYKLKVSLLRVTLAPQRTEPREMGRLRHAAGIDLHSS